MRYVVGLVLLIASPIVLVRAEAQVPPQESRSYYTPEERAEIQALPSADESLRVEAADIDQLLADGEVLFLDVREPEEIADLGTRPDYVNIPLLEIESRLDELPRDKAILTG